MDKDNLIRVFPKVFSGELCDKLIKKFEEAPASLKQRVNGQGVHFTHLNFREAKWEEEQAEKNEQMDLFMDFELKHHERLKEYDQEIDEFFVKIRQELNNKKGKGK